MPIAHTCARCGLNLALVAAPREPVYRLPVVVCPGCREAVVRWSDGHRAISREQSRLIAAVRRVIASAIALAAALTAALSGNYLLMQTTRDDGLTPYSLAAMLLRLAPRDDHYERWIGSPSPIGMGVWVMTSAWAGAYATSAMPHLRRRYFVPAFFALAAALPLVASGLYQLFDQTEAMNSRGPAQPIWLTFDHELRLLRTLPLTGLAALIGIPLGRRIRRSLVSLGAIRRRKLRAFTRRRRQGL